MCRARTRRTVVAGTGCAGTVVPTPVGEEDPVRAWTRIAATAAVVLLMGGCGPQTTTTVRPATGGGVDVQVEVRLPAETARQVSADPALAAQVEQAVARAAGRLPAREAAPDGSLIYRVALPVDRVASSGGLTGVAGIEVSDSGGTVTVTLVRPARLVDAISSATADLEDGAALRAAALAATTVRVSVEFAGGVHSASAGGLSPVVDGQSATVTRTLVQARDRVVFTVTGDPAAPVLTWGRALVVALAAATGLGLWAVRRG